MVLRLSLLAMMCVLACPVAATAAEKACTESVSNTAQLRNRAATAGPGAVVCVRAGFYGAFTIDGRRLSGTMTIQASPGETPAVGGFTITNSSGIAVRGLRVTGDWGLRIVENMTIARNDFDGSHGNLRAVKRSVIEANQIHDLQTSGDEYVGAGLWINSYDGSGQLGPSNPDNGLDGLVIRGNSFARICSDAIQIGGGQHNGTKNVTIEGNTFERIAGECDPSAHADSIQLLGGAGISIVGNTFTRVQNACMFKDDRLDDLLVQNNLMVMSDDTPGGTGIMCQIWDGFNTKVINNTVVAPKKCCLTGFMLRNSGSAIVASNFFTTYSVERAVKAVERNNVIGDLSALDTTTFDPIAGGQLVDRGSADSPPLDRLGRPRYGAPDIGAQELQPGPTPTADSTAPVLKRLSAKPGSVRGRGSFRVRLSVNERATLRMTLHRVRNGRKPKFVKRFTRDVRSGRYTVRIRGAKLKRGRYRVTIVAVDSAGNRSAPDRSRFYKR